LQSIDTIAIGNFDGLHLGHQQLLGRLGPKGAVAVIEHGRACLSPGYFRSRYCPYPMVFYDLHKIKHLTPDDFIHRLQNDFPSLQRVVIGYDFVFGHKQSGDKALLERYFEVVQIPQYRYEGIAVHSKKIKQLLQSDLKMANTLLGRDYVIEGRHVKGQGIGAKELVATLNLQTNFCLPKEGVYLTRTNVDDKWHDSISFVGHRKSTDRRFAVESHLLDTKVVPKQSYIEMAFVSFMRQNRRFETLGALKAQIDNDIELARKEHGKR